MCWEELVAVYHDEAVLLEISEDALIVWKALGSGVVLPELHTPEGEEEGEDAGRILALGLLARQIEHEDLPKLHLSVLEEKLESFRGDGQSLKARVRLRLVMSFVSDGRSITHGSAMRPDWYSS